MRISKIIYSFFGKNYLGGGVQYTELDGIVAYLPTEIGLGTGGGHFESIDCSLKLETATMLS
jgi:hypothetical protein